MIGNVLEKQQDDGSIQSVHWNVLSSSSRKVHVLKSNLNALPNNHTGL